MSALRRAHQYAGAHGVSVAGAISTRGDQAEDRRRQPGGIAGALIPNIAMGSAMRLASEAAGTVGATTTTSTARVVARYVRLLR
jgi:hypothetical protein